MVLSLVGAERQQLFSAPSIVASADLWLSACACRVAEVQHRAEEAKQLTSV